MGHCHLLHFLYKNPSELALRPLHHSPILRHISQGAWEESNAWCVVVGGEVCWHRTVSLFSALNQLGNVQMLCYVIFTSSSLEI